jgi:hypothetical protein
MTPEIIMAEPVTGKGEALLDAVGGEDRRSSASAESLSNGGEVYQESGRRKATAKLGKCNDPRMLFRKDASGANLQLHMSHLPLL